ncbi:hypothetical protein GVO57_14300 (plasmid) [Sphingomonas changnyeongensis]|uniref:Uncharacterized protein n=1 Tax=Sphingomonas changnyeongensis TaxID=2698679 RepID=A0A7Z2S9T0_9SPHN|nr:hypothetical protein [Sphingomonas changnyeongensis]QHL92052.1 hypothetical protein GVO57_14300 [Sphingomonas changnyeongensis]
MTGWSLRFRNIVDVDGQLLALDRDVVDPATLLAAANRPADRQLWLLRAGERLLVQASQMIRLSADEVLFFETADERGSRSEWSAMRLAA